MSSYEKREHYLEHSRTETSDGVESDSSRATEREGSGRCAGHLREADPTYSGRLSKEGSAILAHGNRGRQQSSMVRPEVRKHVIALATTTYAGANQ